jgi:hypothetical protein
LTLFYSGAISANDSYSYDGLSESSLSDMNISSKLKASGDSQDRVADVLPFTFQIHPYFPGRNPSGFFTLFFYENNFVAATQNSPWVYYSRVSDYVQ